MVAILTADPRPRNPLLYVGTQRRDATALAHFSYSLLASIRARIAYSRTRTYVVILALRPTTPLRLPCDEDEVALLDWWLAAAAAAAT